MNIDASMRTVLMYSKKISTSNVTFKEKKSDSAEIVRPVP